MNRMNRERLINSITMIVRRKTVAYRAGVIAFHESGDKAECPYPKKHDQRIDWFMGFFSARTKHRLRHVQGAWSKEHRGKERS
jgi:hypothetical protein